VTPLAATGRRRPRGAATKQAILDAAMELYAMRGFRGTGLIAIGQRAGVTHAGVLYHFGSARDLLLAVIDERDRRLWRETAGTWEGLEGLNALRWLPTVARWNDENRELAKLFTVLQAENLQGDDEGAHEFFVRRRRRVRGRLLRAIRQGRQRGEIRRDIDADTKADEIVAFMEGAQLTALLDPRVDLVGLFESYTETLIRDLAA